MKKKISIVGSGQVGGAIALFASQRELGEIVLTDINPNTAKGKALDILQSSAVLGFEANIQGTSNWQDTRSSDIIVVTAGKPRTPNMQSRLELLKINAQIIDSLLQQLLPLSPDATIIIVTNPVDILTHWVYRRLKLKKNKIMGLGGHLDSARFACFISQELNISMKNIIAPVIGAHGAEMIPLPEHATVGGMPLKQLLNSQDKINAITKRTQNAGSELVSLLQNGSAFIAPAACTTKMVEAIVKDQKQIISCSVPLQGEYDVEDICLNTPVTLGKNGVEKIWEWFITKEEHKTMQNNATIYKKNLEELEKMSAK